MEPEGVPAPEAAAAGAAVATVFICANCARRGFTPTSGVRYRPCIPHFSWPFETCEVLVPCAGRLQPEHLLKAFEEGARVVGVVACAEDNCHCLEGSCRAARRVDYVRRILDDIGLGGRRLMLFHLPGSAREDMVMGLDAGALVGPLLRDDLARQMQAVRDEVAACLARVPRHPLTKPERPASAAATLEEVYETDDSDE